MMTERHSRHPQQALGPLVLSPLSHIITIQPSVHRISQTADPRISGAQHTRRHSEASQEGLATRPRSSEVSPFTFSSHSSIPPGPPYTDPPRYPSSLSLPPPPQPPPKSDEPCREPQREGRGFALSMQSVQVLQTSFYIVRRTEKPHSQHDHIP
jgi:hypothetical protein